MKTSATGGVDGGALPPHPALKDYYADEAEHQAFLQRIFDDTAGDYERMERALALGSGSWYRRCALQRAGLSAGAEVLDVGIGTGLVAREALQLIGPRGRLIGVDPSAGMLKLVGMPQIELLHGRAEALPRPDASCDFLSMGYALRHLSDVRTAFAEFQRVLRPGGRVLVLELTRPPGKVARVLLKAYMRTLLPWFSRLIGCRPDTAKLWRYYWDTIEVCIPPPTVMQALGDSGFIDVKRHVELGIFSEYSAVKPS